MEQCIEFSETCLTCKDRKTCVSSIDKLEPEQAHLEPIPMDNTKKGATTMTKLKMINELNQTDNFKKFGFEIAGDDGENQRIIKKWGRGYMCINRYQDIDDPNFVKYSMACDGWDNI